MTHGHSGGTEIWGREWEHTTSNPIQFKNPRCAAVGAVLVNTSQNPTLRGWPFESAPVCYERKVGDE